jgi:hypothetical protein
MNYNHQLQLRNDQFWVEIPVNRQSSLRTIQGNCFFPDAEGRRHYQWRSQGGSRGSRTPHYARIFFIQLIS